MLRPRQQLAFLWAAKTCIFLHLSWTADGKQSSTPRERLRPHLYNTDEGQKYANGAASRTSVSCTTTHDVTVPIAILGGGMAGVAACRVIQDVMSNERKSKGADYVLIEAQDRLGGRMRSHRIGDYTVEDGANWIEGANGDNENPIWKIAQEIDPPLNVSKQDFFSFNTFNYTGNAVDESTVNARMAEFQAALDCVNSNAENYWKPPSYASVPGRDLGIKQELEDCGWIAASSLDDMIEWFNVDYEYATLPENTSLASFPEGTFTYFGPDSLLVQDERGYEEIAVHHAENCLPSKIEFGREVYQVLYDHDGDTPVQVRTIDVDGNGACIDYNVEKVISTFSIGVLENRPELFKPELDMTNNVYKMNLYQKVFYRFEEKFWDDDSEFINVLNPRERRGDCGFWQSLDKASPSASTSRGLRGKQGSGSVSQQFRGGSQESNRNIIARSLRQQGKAKGWGSNPGTGGNILDSIMPGSNILSCTLVTDAVNSYYNGNVTEEDAMGFLDQLEAVFGSISNVTNIHIPQWQDDPWTFGSYENWLVGKTFDMFQSFFEPRDGHIYISGSASCLNYWGTVHGAYFSGEKSANQVLSDMGVKGLPKWSICDD